MTEPRANTEHAAEWEQILAHVHSTPLALLPTDPRCQICRVPFAGFGGVIGRVMGFKRWNKNPSLCNRCVSSMPPGGIEIDTAVLFADIRGSTGIAERLGAAQFARMLDRFYRVCTDVLVPRRAVIDKMIGDEVMALYLPLAGDEYKRTAVEAALDLQRTILRTQWAGDEPPVGIGLYAGTAFVGNIGEVGVDDFTAIGDTVNVAARLQAEAGPGQVVIGEGLCQIAADLVPEGVSRMLEVRGRTAPVEVRVFTMQ